MSAYSQVRLNVKVNMNIHVFPLYDKSTQLNSVCAAAALDTSSREAFIHYSIQLNASISVPDLQKKKKKKTTLRNEEVLKNFHNIIDWKDETT